MVMRILGGVLITTDYLNARLPSLQRRSSRNANFKTIDEAVAEVYMHRLGGVLCFETRDWWLR
jgi:hypothetical protein